MKIIWSKAVKTLQKLIDFIPTRLPTTRDEFNQYIDSIISIYDFPDANSYRHAIASMIMHMGLDVDRAPRRHFAKAIRKAQANEVCYQVINEIREADKKLREAPVDVAQAESTAEPAPLGEQPKQPVQN